MSTNTLTANPLLDVGFRIPFDQIRPEHAEPAIDALLARAQAALEHLAAAPTRGYRDFMADLDRLGRELGMTTSIAMHLDGVVSSPEWTAAKEAIQPKVTAFYTGLSLHPGLWAALRGFAETEEARALDPVRARHLKLTIDRFRREGAELEGDAKARLLELNTRLAKITSDFGQNVLDATAAYESYVPGERLKGVPARVLDATRQGAQAKGKEGHRLTLHMPVYQPVLTYAEDRELRRELWEANQATGTQEGRDNRPLVREILNLRREKAELLGFANFADYVLQDRMAGTGEAALKFERDLIARTRPAFERENAELEAFYRQHAGADAPALEAWDVAYWAEKQRQAKYDFDEEALRPYFPLDRVLSGLFEITRRVFGATVREARAPGWHPEVKFYEIHDESGTHRASFYTDWFPRDSKRGGAWMNGFIMGGPADDGAFEPHLGLMCGNMTPPSAGGEGEGTPALLSIREVETVFHEFGHLLHQALSRVPVRSLGGTNVAWDFVELPSQIMENWVMERPALDLFARHYQTGEALPDDLFARLIAARNYRAANLAMRQYSFGFTDLTLHVEYDPASDVDPVALARELMADFYPHPLPENFAQVASFGHLFSRPTGYGAGYYSYKWAEVLDADAFSRFAQEGIFNRETGRAFVDSVLSRGNGADPAELYREFMGRDPDPDALLRRSGLLETASGM